MNDVSFSGSVNRFINDRKAGNCWIFAKIVKRLFIIFFALQVNDSFSLVSSNLFDCLFCNWHKYKIPKY